MSRSWAGLSSESSAATNRTSIGYATPNRVAFASSSTRSIIARPCSRGTAYSISVNLMWRSEAKTL